MSSYQQQNELAWRAFHLGIRVARQVHGLGLTQRLDELIPYISALKEIANSETTLNEVSVSAKRVSHEIGQFAANLCNLNVRFDRELAQQILTGGDRATNVESDS